VTCSIVGGLLGGCDRRRTSTDQVSVEPSRPATPTIDFDSRSHDFGVVNEGATPKHSFAVRNTGTAPLLLQAARVSCGCTLAVVKTEEIPPGGSGAIEIALSTRGFPGASHYTVTVVSNDPVSPESILEFKANVEHLLDFDRQYLRLETNLSVGKVEQVWLSGKLAAQANLKVTRTQGDQAVGVRPIQQRGKLKRTGLEFKLKADQVAAGEGSVTVSTGVANPAELDVRFSYRVQPSNQKQGSN
jgi:hypothetical protein